MKKRDLIIYRVATGLFSLNMLFAAWAYFFMYEMAKETFESIGFTESLIYPLAIAKLLGLVAIWTNKSRILKELAYLGFATELMLAIVSHARVEDGEAIGAAMALVVLIVSYIFHRKLYGKKAA